MTVDGIVVSVTPGKDQDGISILQVSGYLDTTTASELESALFNLLQKDQYKIVVDLSGVTYISSAGWGIFIGEIKEIRNNGGDIKLAGMIAEVFEVFQLLEFQTILESYPDIEAAVDAFDRAPKQEKPEESSPETA